VLLNLIKAKRLIVVSKSIREVNSMFSCEMCGDGLAVMDVLAVDLMKYELCTDCVEILREENSIITASKFVGLQ
jgi:hypothetical protein